MVWHLSAKPAFRAAAPDESIAIFGFWEGFGEGGAIHVIAILHSLVTVDAAVAGSVGVIDLVLEVSLFFVVEILFIKLVNVVDVSGIQIGLEFSFIRGLVVGSVVFCFLLVGQNLIGGFRFEGS